MDHAIHALQLRVDHRDRNVPNEQPGLGHCALRRRAQVATRVEARPGLLGLGRTGGRQHVRLGQQQRVLAEQRVAGVPCRGGRKPRVQMHRESRGEVAHQVAAPEAPLQGVRVLQCHHSGLLPLDPISHILDVHPSV